MKRLFIVSVASGYGGAERSIELIARHIPADVRVWLFAQHPEHIAQLSRCDRLPPHVTLIRIGHTSTLFRKRLAALRLALAYRRHRPDSLLLNTHASALLAAMAARFTPELGRRCHLYVRDFLWSDLSYIFGRLAGAKALVPNEVVAERCGYLSPWYLAPTGDVPWEVIPDMVEMPDGPASYGERFLHLATINPFKGHPDLMLAIKTLAERGTPVVVDSLGLVGNAALRERLLGLIDTLGLEGLFNLFPYESDPGARLRSCRAVLVTSVSHSGGPETFGRAVIEAWSHRKAVIAFAAGAPARLIRHGIDGLLVAEGNVTALADAIFQLSTDTELCHRLGEAGYAQAVKLYQASSVTPRLLDHLLAPGDG